jgi:hypothetical protein
LAETARRQGVKAGRIQSVVVLRDAEPGDELPEEDQIIVCAAGKTADLGSLWQRLANTNRRSMMTDRCGTPPSWTRQVRTARRPLIRRIADAMSVTITFSRPSRIPIEPGTCRITAEALGDRGQTAGRALRWLNRSELDLVLQTCPRCRLAKRGTLRAHVKTNCVPFSAAVEAHRYPTKKLAYIIVVVGRCEAFR